MILEHLYQGEPGAWKIVFRASAEELARALAALEAEAGPAPDGGEEDRLAEAVNRAILAPDGFSIVWAEALEKAGLQLVSDPDFKLAALNKAEGFRAEAVFFALPPLTLGQYTGFVQPIEPRPIRRLAIELEINQHHGAEERAADAAGKAQLRDRKSTRLNSSHVSISYAVFCLKKKTTRTRPAGRRPAPGAGPAAPAPPPRATSRTGPCTGSGAPPPHRPCARRPRPSPHAPVSR